MVRFKTGHKCGYSIRLQPEWLAVTSVSSVWIPAGHRESNTNTFSTQTACNVSLFQQFELFKIRLHLTFNSKLLEKLQNEESAVSFSNWRGFLPVSDEIISLGKFLCVLFKLINLCWVSVWRSQVPVKLGSNEPHPGPFHYLFWWRAQKLLW